MGLISKIQFYFKRKRATKEFRKAIEEANQIKRLANESLIEYRRDTNNIGSNMKGIIQARLQIKKANETINHVKGEYKDLFGKPLKV